MEWQQLMSLSHLTLLWNDNYLEYDESLTSHRDYMVGLLIGLVSLLIAYGEVT